MEVLMNTTVLFALGLTLSLIVERVLEILKAAYDIFDSRLDWHHHWTRRARRIKKKLERRLRMFEYVSPEQANAVLRAAHEVVLGPSNGYQGTVPAVSGDLVRAFWVKMVAKFIGMVIGITLAFYFQVDFISLWKTVYASVGAGAGDAVSRLWTHHQHYFHCCAQTFTGFRRLFRSQHGHDQHDADPCGRTGTHADHRQLHRAWNYCHGHVERDYECL